jgi:hypothetical protein
MVAAMWTLAGCTKAEDPAAPKATGTASASLAKLVNPESVDRDSPERTVLGLLRYLQLNTTTLALDLYHPVVARKLTPETIFAGLASQVSAVQNSQVKELASEPSRRGMLVTFLLVNKAGAFRYSYVLRRSAGRWVVIYDTLLEGGLSYVAQARVGLRTGKPATSPEVHDAGDRAAERYRTLFLEGTANADEAQANPNPKSTKTPTPTPTPAG